MSIAYPLAASIILASVLAVGSAQESAPQVNSVVDLKTIVVAKKSASDSAIAVPPLTSMMIAPIIQTGPPSFKALKPDAALQDWLDGESALNGLESSELKQWHVVLTYEQFDRNGDKAHRGSYEEYWASSERYKRIYKSDDFNQTEYATDKGVFRSGDQRWPDRVELAVRSEVLDPFFYAAMLPDHHPRNVERKFSGYKLQCTLIEGKPELSDPAQYCFEPGTSILRYAHGLSWNQTVYNRIITFQGRNLAQEVDVTDGGKPYLQIRLQTIESIPQVEESTFQPPPDAIGPLSTDRVSGVEVIPLWSTPPQWPRSLKDKSFTVVVEAVIGKDGHVISAHAISGPPEGYNACENSVMTFIFRPSFVRNRPVEVEQQIECANSPR